MMLNVSTSVSSQLRVFGRRWPWVFLLLCTLLISASVIEAAKKETKGEAKATKSDLVKDAAGGGQQAPVAKTPSRGGWKLVFALIAAAVGGFYVYFFKASSGSDTTHHAPAASGHGQDPTPSTAPSPSQEALAPSTAVSAGLAAAGCLKLHFTWQCRFYNVICSLHFVFHVQFSSYFCFSSFCLTENESNHAATRSSADSAHGTALFSLFPIHLFFFFSSHVFFFVCDVVP
jgi:hypothetical protein